MPCFGMPQELKVLAIIPARKGSKRLPGKNTMMFRGKPLVQWSIEQAKEAKYISQVVVTSDDDKVLELAIRNHCDAVVRPFQLAADATPMNVVVEHVLGLYTCDYVVLLQPTSPLRWCLDIDRCIEKSWAHGKPVVSMCKGELNGAVYVSPLKNLKQTRCFATGALIYEMPENRSVDIDTAEDFERALCA